MTDLKVLKRVFVVGAVKLTDPLPSGSLDEATRLLALNYPQFRWSRVLPEDGIVVGDTLEFNLQLPPPKING